MTTSSIIFNQKISKKDNYIIRAKQDVPREDIYFTTTLKGEVVDTTVKNGNSSKYSTCSEMTFYGRMNEILKCLTNDVDRFDFSNIVIAGGLISAIMEKDFEKKTDIYANSDIDIFVYGLNQSNTLKKIQQLYDCIQEKYNYEEISFTYPASMVVTILIPNVRPIQIVGTEKKTDMELISDFDLTHCQIGYGSSGLIYTPAFFEAITTKTTTITKTSIQAYRLVKAYLRGYDVKLPNNQKLYIKNYYAKYTFVEEDKKKIPINTNKIRDPYDLDINELLNDDIVKMNLNKSVILKTNPRLYENVDELLLEQKKQIENAWGKEYIYFIKGNTIEEMKKKEKIDLREIQHTFFLQRRLLS